MTNYTLIGYAEHIDLPELGLFRLPVKVDSGAQTSSLHVDELTLTKVDNKDYVSFELRPEYFPIDQVIKCQCELYDTRNITSSNGIKERRYVIKTPISFAAMDWHIEITLTNRSKMKFMMLFGRQAMSERFLIDVSKTYMFD
ncbi:ATP-dependent zinc protease [Thalassotalea aquiviva]|uniref:ATP-dependent zinc protease family protein n=1 Tax=Thalassotalea aquiviva TaxID=3242415 RepID=UPI00352A6A40